MNGSQDAASPGRQKLYLAALGTLPEVSVRLGRFRTHPVFMPLVTPASGGSATGQVHKTEEKGSDVNLATYLLLDGMDEVYDEALVISDDSDLIEPIHHANARFGPVHVISPRGPIQTPKGPQLPFGMANAGASWTQLRVADLLAAQLPSPLTLVSGRTIHRPPGWR